MYFVKARKFKIFAQSGGFVRDQNGGFQGVQKSFKNLAEIDAFGVLGRSKWSILLILA